MDDEAIVRAMLASEDPYFRILGMLGQLKLVRGTQYNTNEVKLEDYFPFHRISYVQMVWVKALRARAQIHGKQSEFLDSMLDLANYSIFAAMAEKEMDKDARVS